MPSSDCHYFFMCTSKDRALLVMMFAAAAAATAVVYALTDGGYSDDAELAFIQCFLQDNRLQAVLRVSVTEMHFV